MNEPGVPSAPDYRHAGSRTLARFAGPQPQIAMNQPPNKPLALHYLGAPLHLMQNLCATGREATAWAIKSKLLEVAAEGAGHPGLQRYGSTANLYRLLAPPDPHMAGHPGFEVELIVGEVRLIVVEIHPLTS